MMILLIGGVDFLLFGYVLCKVRGLTTCDKCKGFFLMKCKIIFCSERLGLRKDVLSSLVTKGIDQDQRVEKNVLDENKSYN